MPVQAPGELVPHARGILACWSRRWKTRRMTVAMASASAMQKARGAPDRWRRGCRRRSSSRSRRTLRLWRPTSSTNETVSPVLAERAAPQIAQCLGVVEIGFEDLLFVFGELGVHRVPFLSVWMVLPIGGRACTALRIAGRRHRYSAVAQIISGANKMLCYHFNSRGSKEHERNKRVMAQFGSALDWGSRGRRFESCSPDQ